MTAAPLTVRRLEGDDEPAVLRLLDAALAGGPTGRRSTDFYRWKHQANPFGPSPGLVAEADGQIVGVRLFLRWELAAEGRLLRAVRAVDTATHPGHQGRGIFRTLTLAALEALREDTDLVFNTPNGNSRPGYLKMGWQPVGRVPIAVRPVRLARFARHVRSAAHGSPAGRAGETCPLPAAATAFAGGLEGAGALADPAALADLLAEADAGRPRDRLHTRRTPAYLRWRYADAPGLDYRVITVHRRGELRGVAFARPRRRGALRELTLSELVVAPGDRSAARALLTEAARRSGCDHVATHLSTATISPATGRSAGYLVWPGVGMELVTRPLRDGLAPDPACLASWDFSLGDLEVF